MNFKKSWNKKGDEMWELIIVVIILILLFVVLAWYFGLNKIIQDIGSKMTSWF